MATSHSSQDTREGYNASSFSTIPARVERANPDHGQQGELRTDNVDQQRDEFRHSSGHPQPSQESIEPASLPPAKSDHAPFSCNVCSKSYTRVDHLARHYRSHTRERPFSCEICGKDFARADLLRRHTTAHGSVNDSDSNKRKREPSPHARVSLACTACASSKLKCKEEKPCRRCVQKGIDCVTPTSDNSFIRHQAPPIDHNYPTPSSAHEHQLGRLDHSSANHFNAPLHIASPTHEYRLDPSQILITPTNDQFSHAQPQHYPTPMVPTPMVPTQMVPPGPAGADTNPSVMMYSNQLQPLNPMTSVPVASDAWLSDDASLGDFLSDIMMPVDSQAAFMSSNSSEGTSDYHIRDVMNFGTEDHFEFDLGDMDFGLLNYNFIEPSLPRMQQQEQLTSKVADDGASTPRGEEDSTGMSADANNLGAEAFQRSVWRWIPGNLDGAGEQMDLSLPSDIGITGAHTDRPCEERLSQRSRDRVMAMLFATCDGSAMSRIVSQFPSVEVLDCLVQDFLFYYRSHILSYIHIPTFAPNSMRPETISIAAACGAVRNSVNVIRKLGLALQDIVRIATFKAMEADNSLTRNHELLQCYLLSLNLGIWSGSKRVMEIAESNALPLVTILRRSGRFKRHRPSPDGPQLGDPPDILSSKWRTWVEAESFKRLAFALIIYDGCVSMAFFTPPLISYSECSLDLPASSSLWNAKSAIGWRDVYLSQRAGPRHKVPDLSTCMLDAHAMLEVYEQIDSRFSFQIMLSLLWRLVWDARQLSAVTKHAGTLRPGALSSLSSGHWQQDLGQTLQNFRMVITDVQELSPAAIMIYEHLLLNIHVSFEELSTFSGKEGAREARRALPLLRQWAESRESRQAVWHAGQVLRAATQFKPGSLREFLPVILYHAGLALWAYGILSHNITRSDPRSRPFATGESRSPMPPPSREIVILDGIDTSETQKFIAMNRATPAIRRWPLYQQETGGNQQSQTATSYVTLDDPAAVMETVINVLQCNHTMTASKSVPPLVENLLNLMRDLSRAAAKVNRR